jgi:hypothetical protein
MQFASLDLLVLLCQDKRTGKQPVRLEDKKKRLATDVRDCFVVPPRNDGKKGLLPNNRNNSNLSNHRNGEAQLET